MELCLKIVIFSLFINFFSFLYYYYFLTLFQIHGSRLLTSGPKTEWSWWCPDVWDTCMKKDPPHPNACNISCLLDQVAVLLSTWVKNGLFKTFHFSLWFIFKKQQHLDKWRMEWIKMELCLEVVLAEMNFLYFHHPLFLDFLNCLYLCFRFSGLFLTQNEMRWIKIQKTLSDFSYTIVIHVL